MYKEALKASYLPNGTLEESEWIYEQASRFSKSMESIENSYATFVELERANNAKL